MALVQRDPFARTEIHKQVWMRGGCSWCPQQGVRVYEYWCESDGGRRYEFSGAFCSVACFRAYHDIERPK